MLVHSVPYGRKYYGLKRFLREFYWKVSDPVSSSVSYVTLTHVKSLEGYYGTTTPTVLVHSDMDGRNHYGFRLFWSKTFSKQSNQTGSFASYWNRTNINRFEGYYATTAPKLLLNFDMEGEEQALELFCNKYHCKISVNAIGSASYGNRTMSKTWKATKLPLHQRGLSLLTWKRKTSGLTFYLYQMVMKEVLSAWRFCFVGESNPFQ